MRVRTAVLTLVLAAGCSNGPAEYEVSGTVRFDGRLVPTGEIIFTAADGRVTPASGAITDGRYQFRVRPGAKRVEVRASRQKPGPGPMGEAFVYEAYVPARYNRDTELRADVTPGGPNRFDFELTSSPP